MPRKLACPFGSLLCFAVITFTLTWPAVWCSQLQDTAGEDQCGRLACKVLAHSADAMKG